MSQSDDTRRRSSERMKRAHAGGLEALEARVAIVETELAALRQALGDWIERFGAEKAPTKPSRSNSERKDEG